MKYILIIFFLFSQLTWAVLQEQANQTNYRAIVGESHETLLDILFHKPSQTKHLGENLCELHDTEEYICLPNAISKPSYEVVDSVPQDVWVAFQEQVSQADYRAIVGEPHETLLDILFHKPSQTKHLGENLCERHDTEEYICLPNAISQPSYEVVDSVPQDVWVAFQEQVSTSQEQANQADYRAIVE